MLLSSFPFCTLRMLSDNPIKTIEPEAFRVNRRQYIQTAEQLDKRVNM